MKTESIVWAVILTLLVIGLACNAVFRHAGQAHVKVTPHDYVMTGHTLQLPWGGDKLEADLGATEEISYEHPDGNTYTVAPPTAGNGKAQIPWRNSTYTGKWVKRWESVDELTQDLDVEALPEDRRITWESQVPATMGEWNEAEAKRQAALEQFELLQAGEPARDAYDSPEAFDAARTAYDEALASYAKYLGGEPEAPAYANAAELEAALAEYEVAKAAFEAGTGEEPESIPYKSVQELDEALAIHAVQLARFERQLNSTPPPSLIRFSWSRTLGIWVAAFFTLAIFSFLYKDNPFYKMAESVVVGVSAAYWMVVAFWSTIVPNLLGKLMPAMVKGWAMPGLEGRVEWLYIVPLVFSILLLMRLSPKGAWISRWPLAFIIGTTAGIRMIGFIHADFLSQIRNSVVSLYNPVMVNGQLQELSTFWDSLAAVILVIGVLSCLVYFFFSIEHKGLVGKTAKLGIWFLMITFGAAFGYTVMGRIALLAIRIEFIVDDWLWIIDPLQRRAFGG